MKIIDTHVHLNDQRFFEDINAVIERAIAADVRQMINVGADYKTSLLAVEQAHQYRGLHAAIGIHPHHAAECDPSDLEKMRSWVTDNKIVAWGEIGLDYHYDFAPKITQQEIFDQQLALAEQVGLPVIIHNREAHQDVYEMLAKYRGRVLGVLHCYSGSVEMAAKFLDLGYYISIAGPITFNNARKLPDVAKYVPLDRLLIETDCPYLAPVPYRGKRNEPAYVRRVAEKIAELRGLPLEMVAENTTQNAYRLFKMRVCDA